jgi:hypothetical protein
MKTHITEKLRGRVALTLQLVIAKLGPVPDDCGEALKKTLGVDHDLTLLGLGVALEDAAEAGSYESLKRDLSTIADWVKKREKNGTASAD